MTAKSGITQEELIKWGGADVFNQALALCNSGLVKSVNFDKDTLRVSGKIEQPDGWQMPVSFVLKENFTIFSKHSFIMFVCKKYFTIFIEKPSIYTMFCLIM